MKRFSGQEYIDEILSTCDEILESIMMIKECKKTENSQFKKTQRFTQYKLKS